MPPPNPQEEVAPPSPIGYAFSNDNRDVGENHGSPRRHSIEMALKSLEDGAIDDLLSLGSGAGAMGSSLSLGSGGPSSSFDNHHHNNNSMLPESWRLSNPVHMELQENAKLPTFNWAVDRTGSVEPMLHNPHFQQLFKSSGSSVSAPMGTPRASSINAPPPQMTPMTDSAGPTDIDDEINLAELFLRSNKRASSSATYQRAGVLKQDTTQLVAEALTPMDATNELDPLTALGVVDVDPTPLSEIKSRARKHHAHFPLSPQRNPPLPIPGLSQPTTATNNLVNSTAAAVATAAAIASQQRTSGSRSLSSSIPLATTAGRPRPTYNAPQNATKHAHRLHSQYGFGVKHVVPSVPAPPMGPAAKRHKNSGPNRPTLPPPVATTRLPKSTKTKGTSPIPTDDGSTTAAYERKKQRAKDARVKLNESIDRLSIAMSLAGTQSKHRTQQWRQLPLAENRAEGLQITKDCVETAESAQKWDRPSFVGIAAKLIHGLNAQCEALMRELSAVHQTGCANTTGDGATYGHTTIPQSIHVRTEKRSTPSPPLQAGIKRQRVSPQTALSPIPAAGTNGTTGLSDDSPIFTQGKVVDRISSFLDPRSLVRCYRVSKKWRETATLANESVWETLVMRRFGYYSVRQWRDKMNDADDDEGKATTSMVLYRSMDRANAMPHFQHDGLLFLGDARLPGQVSAWTYLVERSNGETLRSVRREPSMSGNGIFASLPVVELRTIVQNTGLNDRPLVLRKQTQTVDASTRRRGEEMKEIEWDDRFQKRVLNLDGSNRPPVTTTAGFAATEDLCQLQLFDVVVIVSYIFAKGCSTTAKFVQRSNFTKVLVQISNGTTVPLVITFPRDAAGLHL